MIDFHAHILPGLDDGIQSLDEAVEVIEEAKKALYTGNIGDGKIFVYGLDNVVKIRTGEEGFDALQEPEEE